MHRPNLALFRWLCLLSFFFAGSAHANYYSIIHDSTDISSTGQAIAVAMPASDTGSIRINRIRLSTNKTTALDYTFRANRDTTSLGDLTSMASFTCNLPGCIDLFTANGILSGGLFDFKGLSLDLAPDQRLHVYASGDIGASQVTIELWWSNR